MEFSYFVMVAWAMSGKSFRDDGEFLCTPMPFDALEIGRALLSTFWLWVQTVGLGVFLVVLDSWWNMSGVVGTVLLVSTFSTSTQLVSKSTHNSPFELLVRAQVMGKLTNPLPATDIPRNCVTDLQKLLINSTPLADKSYNFSNHTNLVFFDKLPPFVLLP